MDNKLVAMFVALVGGCYLYLFLGNLTGIIDLPLNYSTLLPILGVTTILFSFMAAVYKAAEGRVP